MSDPISIKEAIDQALNNIKKAQERERTQNVEEDKSTESKSRVRRKWLKKM